MVRLVDTASTNLEALDRARAGDPGRVWVVAERQSGGRARRGRVWTSEPGNLYATALLIDPCAPRNLPELPFVAATAAARAVARHAAVSGRRVDVKWPNDLLIGGAKISGILLETTRTPSGATAVAIGIGINCVHHPRDTETPATDLLAEGIDASPARLFPDLEYELAAGLALWNRGEGFAGVRAQWLAHAVGLGGRIRVRLVEGEDEGLFEAIDDTGRLILRRDDGTMRLISAGDVFFPGRPSEEK
ncbi:MAG: biotin--[acetyl-CoA-carboxylase] ligase [Siculibacillus sp.]